MRLEPIAEGLWGVPGRVRFVGQMLPVRATVARLHDGSLLVYSPVEAGPELFAELARLGPVRHLVAPSKYHHLWLGDWARAFPQATRYAVPGLPEKRPDLCFDALLSDQAPAEWRDDFQQLVFHGLPILNELVMCHLRSGSLVVSDLVFNVHHAEGALARLLLRANGMWQHFGPSRMLSLLMRRTRDAARDDLAQILTWDFDRVIPAHGEVLESGARAALLDAFRFLGVRD